MVSKGIVLMAIFVLFINIGITAAAETDIPDLKGTWENVYRLTGSDKTELIEMDGDATFTYVIENQTGQYFEGYMTYMQPSLGKLMKEGVRGIITEDGKRFYEVQDLSGYGFGEITGPDSFSWYYLHTDIPDNETPIKESRVVFGKFVRSAS